MDPGIMRKLLPLLFLLWFALAAAGQDPRAAVKVDGNGTVTSPANFYTQAASALGLSSFGTVAGNNTFTGNNTFNGTVTFAQNKYPVFDIPMPPGQGWTDFEIKASVVNFSTSNSTTIYWYNSAAPASGGYLQPADSGPKPDVYFTDSGFTRGEGNPYDARSWRKQDQSSNTNSIAYLLTDGNSTCGGAVAVLKDGNGFFADNQNTVVFDYTLLTHVSGECDAASRTIWHPITPSKWVGDTFQPGQGHLP